MAGDPSAGGAIPPIGVDPNTWYALQRKQAMVDALSQRALTPVPENNYGPIRSRTGIAGPLGQLASAWMAKKGMQDLPGMQAQVYHQMLTPFGGGGPSAAAGPDAGGGGGAAPPADPNAPQMPPPAAGGPPGAAPSAAAPSAAAPPSGAPGVSPPPGPTGAPSAGGGANTPLNPMGLPPALAMQMFMKDPAKYGELLLGPNEWRTALMATGGNQKLAGQMLLDKLQKEGMIDVRPGGMILGKNPDGSQFMLRNPQLGAGQEPTFDSHWHITGSTLIPGAAAGEQEMERAKHTGEAQGTLHEVPTSGGGKTPVFGIPAGIPGSPAAPGPAPSAGGGSPNAPRIPNLYAGAPGSPASASQETDPFWKNLPKRRQYGDQFGTDPYSEIMNKKEADRHVELSEKYGEESDLADQRMGFNKIARDSLPASETGPLSDYINHVRSAAQQAGVPEALIPGWAKVAPSQEMRKALIRNAIVSLKPNFGGRPAASEFNVLKEEANPSDTMTKLAIKRLLDIDDELGVYQKQRGADFEEAMDRGGSAIKFPTYYSNRRPMAAKIENLLHPPTREEVAAEIARRKAAAAPAAAGP